MSQVVDVRVKQLEGILVYRWRETPFRLDVWPFATAYASILTATITGCGLVTASICMGVAVALQVLLFLFCHWMVDVKCFVACSLATGDLEERLLHGNVIKVLPTRHGGKKELCALIPPTDQLPDISFEYQKQRFIYSSQQKCFMKLVSRTKEPFGQYSRYTGYGTEALLETARRRWGPNVFQIPVPSFWSLFKMQMLAPFFVFQVFCMSLWCMDEYWYYSLFTLGMLILFECTVTKSRLRTLEELRTLATPMQPVLVHRNGKWERVEGTDLVPGDVISIGRPSAIGGEDLAVPADVLLLAGSCIVNESVLTGESTPQWKMAIDTRDPKEMFNPKSDQNHIIFSGTKIIQHTQEKLARIRTPDGGCLALVQRTGFGTSQGKLMRTIMFATEQVTAHNQESALFICFFLVFALAAAGYVLKHGLDDPNRSRYKLFLNCSMIITSVIPPELPMELSIAVNTSLMALVKLGVFCTEPFRIPLAGKIDVCCFDKTGTLTSDEMMFEGVVEPKACAEMKPDAPDRVFQRGLRDMSHRILRPELECLGVPWYNDLEAVPEMHWLAHCVLAACHSLVYLDNKLVGDPVERASLEGAGWSYKGNDVVVSHNKLAMTLRIMARHHFSSALKRMSVLMRVEEGYEKGSTYALVKGAPETVAERLAVVPEGYHRAYKHYACQGARVLALAVKKVPDDITLDQMRAMTRGDIERDLEFVGFSIFSCPVKRESEPTVALLHRANHASVMITGDACLTACHVAAHVRIVTRKVLILTAPKDTSLSWSWTSPDESVNVPFAVRSVQELRKEFDLCVGGDGLLQLQKQGVLEDAVKAIQVYARVNPEQKELVLQTLKGLGLVTLMCGDGTNDVGALKTADVGVALLQATGQKTRRRRSERDRLKPAAGRVGRKGGKESKTKSMHDVLMENEHASGVPVVRLGDASMASAFTAKATSIHPVQDLVRQGRCTLVTTVQMYKILGLNCLCTAYILSVQYLDGVKLGDTQATCHGILTAMLFLFLSHAKPLPILCSDRPYTSIFCPYWFLSVLGQFAVHLTFLITGVNGAVAYMPKDAPKIDPDSDFSPNIVNTVSYLVNVHIMITTFAVNYTGSPFNTPLLKNTPLIVTLVGTFAVLMVTMAGAGEAFEEMLELVPIPIDFRGMLMAMAATDTVLAMIIESVMRKVFPSVPANKLHAHQSMNTRKNIQTKKEQ